MGREREQVSDQAGHRGYRVRDEALRRRRRHRAVQGDPDQVHRATQARVHGRRDFVQVCGCRSQAAHPWGQDEGQPRVRAVAVVQQGHHRRPSVRHQRHHGRGAGDIRVQRRLWGPRRQRHQLWHPRHRGYQGFILRTRPGVVRRRRRQVERAGAVPGLAHEGVHVHRAGPRHEGRR